MALCSVFFFWDEAELGIDRRTPEQDFVRLNKDYTTVEQMTTALGFIVEIWGEIKQSNPPRRSELTLERSPIKAPALEAMRFFYIYIYQSMKNRFSWKLWIRVFMKYEFCRSFYTARLTLKQFGCWWDQTTEGVFFER